MELLYLYIPESAGYIYKNAEINFSARHQFHFDKQTRKLSSVENLKAVDGSFFTTEKYGKDNIVSSISAIVGDNGAGKTTIADFLHKIQLHGGLEHILIWKDSQGKFKWSAFVIPENLNSNEFQKLQQFLDADDGHPTKKKISLQDIYKTKKNNLFQVDRSSKSLSAMVHKLNWASTMGYASEFSFPKTEENSPISLQKMRGTNGEFTFIYSSNFYTPLHDIESVNETIDISTSQFLKRDKETAENGTATGLHPISAHFYMEMMRNAELIARFKALPKEPDWKIPTPKGVYITPSTSDLSIFRGKLEKEIREAIRQEFKSKFKNEDELKRETEKLLKRELESNQPQYCSLLRSMVYRAIEPLPGRDITDAFIYKEDTSYERFVITLFKCFLANFFRYDIQKDNYIGSEPELADYRNREKIEEQETIESLQRYINSERTAQSVLNCCDELSKIKRIESISRNGRPSRTEDKFGDFKTIINLLILENIRQDGYYIDLGDKKGLEHFDRILNLYFDANTITHFMAFQWSPRISGGELAQLNIYSRLLDTLKLDGGGYSNLKNDIVVFFDEIETTIHPRLQRRLVSNLIEFFNVFFKDAKFKLHLIFASHSPILLSDIPRDQTILLKRDGKSVVVLPAQQETFSANIHSLYEHHFRMGDKDESLIGQFAFEKIRELVKKIEALDPEAIDQGKVDEIERELSVVGEPFMKHKITELLEEKMNKTAKKRFREIRLKQLKDEARQLEKEIEGGLDD